MRQDGYYWVKLRDDLSPWTVGEFHQANGGYWRLPNLEYAFWDHHFGKINETRILGPDEADNPQLTALQNRVAKQLEALDRQPWADALTPNEEPPKRKILSGMEMEYVETIRDGENQYHLYWPIIPITPEQQAHNLKNYSDNITFTRLSNIVPGATKDDLVMGIAIEDCRKGQITKVITKGFVQA